MIIGGLLKNSLIDYRTKISCVLFTAGCNFNCPYCHNPELVRPPFNKIDLKEIFAFLDKRKSLLDGVVITGGEPTLQADLIEFCSKIKSFGFAVKLDTNGSRPEMIQSLIESCYIDYIAMDIKTIPEKYSPFITKTIPADKIIDSIHFIRNSGIPHEFRTTCVKPFVDAKTIQQICAIIEGADLFVLQQVKINDSVLHPEFFQNHAWKITANEIRFFQDIAAPFVKKTLIR